MGLGIRLRKLWHLKLGVLISLVVALLAAFLSVYNVGPGGVTPRSLAMATASAHVVVDTPKSIMTDLRQDIYSIDSLVNRAVVLGNVIASSSVEEKIAQEAHIPGTLLRIQAPLTAQQSALPVNSQNQRQITDIIKLNDQYRIQINANPTVPMLDIYAQAPTATSAAALANAAVDQLKAYVANVATRQGTPPKDQTRLVQLGRATGIVINPGVQYQVAVLAFILTFLASCATVVFVARVRAGWRVASLSGSATGT
ncbi:MAG TPA: hypothetical protein VGL78_16180 [Solirubrobacteraceae bacterium]